MVNSPNSTVTGTSTFGLDVSGNAELARAARQNSPAAIKAAAQQFEGLFLNMVMKAMRQASPQDGVFDSEQSKMFTSMLDQQMAQNMSKRGVGLADVLVRQLSNNRGMAPEKGVQGTERQPLPGLKMPQASVDGEDQLLQSLQQSGMLKEDEIKRQLRLARKPVVADFNLDAAAAAAGLTALPGTVGAAASAGSTGASSADASSAVAGNAALAADSLGNTNPNSPAHVQAFQARLGAHAEEASRTTGIPARFMLGQAALESGWGKREIMARDGSNSHNVFGIKAGSGWKGKVVETATTEYVDGVPQKRIERFRAYDSYADAFRDYARMLSNNPRYENVIANARDANSFAQGLQRAGYATDPNYAAKLARIIKQTTV
ncbi:MAG: flagellar assembly peptidoglycan hydrolase FlgJ [Janthinobacterium lividum]